jgi:hypothetical protein
MIAGKLIHADANIAGRHYPDDRLEWITSLGRRSVEDNLKFGMNVIESFGTDDHHQIGMTVRNWLVDMISSDLVFVCVFE